MTCESTGGSVEILDRATELIMDSIALWQLAAVGFPNSSRHVGSAKIRTAVRASRYEERCIDNFMATIEASSNPSGIALAYE